MSQDYKAGLVGQDDRLHSVAEVELGQDPGDVCAYRRLARYNSMAGSTART